MVRKGKANKVHLVFECFTKEAQYLLDDYQSGKLDLEAFFKGYKEVSRSQYNLELLRNLLVHIKTKN